MPINIVAMSIGHYPAVRALWENSRPHVYLGPSDEREGIRFYLRRNPRLSLVALDGGEVVGAILVGHDGRWGILHHLAVAPSRRKRGIGRGLVDEALRRLERAGIRRGLIAVYTNNNGGWAFWRQGGWQEMQDVTWAMKRIDSPAGSAPRRSPGRRTVNRADRGPGVSRRGKGRRSAA